MTVVSVALLAAIVGWNGQATSKSKANGKAIICEPKYLIPSNSPKGLVLRGYIFKSDEVILETIYQDGDRFKIDTMAAQAFHSEGNYLKWGSYNTFLRRWTGTVLDRKTLELGTDGGSVRYRCELYRTHWKYRNVMREHMKSLQAQLNETLSQNKI